MKRLATIAVLALLTITSTAQQYTYELRQDRQAPGYFQEYSTYYGLRIGLGISHVSSDEAVLDAGGSKSGIAFGGVMGFQLAPSAPVYLEAGLMYVEKGGKGTTSDNHKYTYGMHYIELPLVLKYKIETLIDLDVLPFFGGYFAYGVGGKMRDYTERTSTNSFADDRFKRFDAGLRLGCGVGYKVMYAELAYEWGLYNVCHSDFDKSHTGCLYLTAGVNF